MNLLRTRPLWQESAQNCPCGNRPLFGCVGSANVGEGSAFSSKFVSILKSQNRYPSPLVWFNSLGVGPHFFFVLSRPLTRALMRKTAEGNARFAKSREIAFPGDSFCCNILPIKKKNTRGRQQCKKSSGPWPFLPRFSFPVAWKTTFSVPPLAQALALLQPKSPTMIRSLARPLARASGPFPTRSQTLSKFVRALSGADHRTEPSVIRAACPGGAFSYAYVPSMGPIPRGTPDV